MDLDTVIGKTPDAILSSIAERVKKRRLELNLTQKGFAKRAGIGYDAYRKFENTGEITLRNLVMCAITLDDIEAFEQLFLKRTYQSMDELLKEDNKIKRQRGSKNE